MESKIRFSRGALQVFSGQRGKSAESGHEEIDALIARRKAAIEQRRRAALRRQLEKPATAGEFVSLRVPRTAKAKITPERRAELQRQCNVRLPQTGLSRLAALFK